MLIVQKYGGTSLADAERIQAAAGRAVGLCRQGHRVVLVVSAQGDTTDDMIQKAASLNRRGSSRAMDALLGWPAVSLTGWQAGIATDGVHGNARIQHISGQRIREELDQGKIVVVAGFQGVDAEGDITTLGRGGSDTTAVALAGWLKADKCQIFTDVDGVYDRDPRRFPDATRFGRISYEKMLTLIENGAQVLHDRSVETARDYGIAVEVLSAFTGAPGTMVGDSESL